MLRQKKPRAVLRHHRVPRPEYVLERIGRKAEQRFRKICRRFLPKEGTPPWLVNIALSTHQEDMDGADFFAETEEGFRIPIDVKSSKSAVYDFKKKLLQRREDRSHVILLAVDRNTPEFEIWCRMVGDVSVKRLELLAERAARD